MGVVDLRSEEDIEKSGEQGVSDIAVLPRHGARFDPALEPRAHAKVSAVDERAHHVHSFAEVIGAVGVAHDQIAAPGPLEAAAQGRAIAFFGYGDHPGAQAFRQGLATVRAAIVSHHHLAG